MGPITAQVEAGPPGMMAGPLRAPSSPPETPAPMKRKPNGVSQASRRSVSVNRLLPPSMTMSSRSSRGSNCSITASTGAPALTISMILRGRARLATKSASVAAPCRRLPGWAATNSRVTSGLRL